MNVMSQLNTALSGRYVIEREIGKGGMATVFLALDERHNRKVALKLLDPELGAMLGAERFLSEIRVTANLQHPNLLPLFDSGEANGLLYYVMPYVEGESLRTRLEREKQLPVDEAVRIAAAIASALDYAHRRGVIHRDLKPENVLLHEGQPLVADFGIALAVSNAGGTRVTQTGLSLGTPQYMSPEQATGDRSIDGRTDIYSLGAVAYEMLTGEPPHGGTTAQAIIAKLMTEEPRAITVLRRSVPAHVNDTVLCALEKLPADRFAVAREFADALTGRAGVRSSSYRPAAAGSARKESRVLGVLPWTLAAGALLGMVYLATRPAPAAAPVRFKLDLSNAKLVDGTGTSVAISPDGRVVAYVGQGPQRMVFVRRTDQLETVALPGSELAQDVEFSPDGRWISFIADLVLKRVPVEGGAPVTIARIPTLSGTAWGVSDDILYTASDTLWRIPAPGQNPVRVTQVDRARELQISDPYVLPDGGNVVFTVRVGTPPGAGIRQLGVVGIDGENRTVLDLPATTAIGYTDGKLIFSREDGTIAAISFDPANRRLSGEPVSLQDGVLTKGNGGGGASLSRSGSLIFIRGQVESFIALRDVAGKTETHIGDRKVFSNPVWSPDGRRIAVIATGTGSGPYANLWVYDLTSKVFSRLTSKVSAMRPAWTADGGHVAFVNSSMTNSTLWQVSADGSTPEEPLLELDGVRIREVTLSRDGRFALYRTDAAPDGTTMRDIWMLPLVGERRPVPAVQGQHNDVMPDVSPDSRWVAYQSDETGTFEVYVRPLPGPGGRIQISQGGGVEPRWTRDGRRIIYRDNTAFRSATVSIIGDRLSVSRRDSLFPDRYRRADIGRQNYDVASDGRFVMIRDATESADIVVVVNWLREVEAKLRDN